MRAKTPPPAVPAKADAQAKAKSLQEIRAMPNEQLLDTYDHLRTKGAGKKDPEMPNPSATPAALGPQVPPRPMQLSQSGAVTGTLASTKDPYQNVASPAEQNRRREIRLAAALKRKAENMSQQGGADFVEQVELARAIHNSEIEQILAD